MIAGLGGWMTCRGIVGWAIRGMSEISYGLYIMHLTILQSAWYWTQYGFWTAVTGAAIITFVLATLSWQCFERPILRYRPKHISQQPSLTPSLAAAQVD